MRKEGAILTTGHARARSATPQHRSRPGTTWRTIGIPKRHLCECGRNRSLGSRTPPCSTAPHSSQGAMRKEGAILTKGHARARSATPPLLSRPGTTWRTIDMLARHRCECGRNRALGSRTPPCSTAPHSSQGAMRKEGAVLTKGHARARSAIPWHRSRSWSGLHALQILTHRPCEYDGNCTTKSRDLPSSSLPSPPSPLSLVRLEEH